MLIEFFVTDVAVVEVDSLMNFDELIFCHFLVLSKQQYLERSKAVALLHLVFGCLIDAVIW